MLCSPDSHASTTSSIRLAFELSAAVSPLALFAGPIIGIKTIGRGLLAEVRCFSISEMISYPRGRPG